MSLSEAYLVLMGLHDSMSASRLGCFGHFFQGVLDVEGFASFLATCPLLPTLPAPSARLLRLRELTAALEAAHFAVEACCFLAYLGAKPTAKLRPVPNTTGGEPFKRKISGVAMLACNVETKKWRPHLQVHKPLPRRDRHNCTHLPSRWTTFWVVGHHRVPEVV